MMITEIVLKLKFDLLYTRSILTYISMVDLADSKYKDGTPDHVFSVDDCDLLMDIFCDAVVIGYEENFLTDDPADVMKIAQDLRDKADYLEKQINRK